MAASTTGSTACCGMEPWPPRPYTVTLMLSAADMNGPEHVATVPAMPGSRCWASATSGTGMRLNRPSSTMLLGAVAGLLGGLEQRDQGPVPLAAVVGHELGHADHAGHVHVVPAGVVDRHLVAAGVLDGDGARVRRAGVLPQRQRVQLAAEQHGGPAAVGQDARHPGAADALLDREAVAPQLLGDAPGGRCSWWDSSGCWCRSW